MQVSQAVPANTATPAVASTPSRVAPVPGDVATCAPGNWDPTPVAVFFQWLRDGAPIPGATGATHTVQAADRTKQLACRVVATNAGGAGLPATSPLINVAPACVDIDSDGDRDDDADGLCDNWEQAAGGIDVNGDGTLDLRPVSYTHL